MIHDESPSEADRALADMNARARANARLRDNLAIAVILACGIALIVLALKGP